MIGALILGLLAGFIGKALMPGKDPGGFIVTILLGLAGSVIGFLIFTELLGIGDNDAFDLGGLIGAIIGTMILLFAYRKFVRRRRQRPDHARARLDPRRHGISRSPAARLVRAAAVLRRRRGPNRGSASASRERARRLLPDCDQAARVLEVVGAPERERRLDAPSFRYQIVNAPSSSEPRTISSSQLDTRARRTRARPSRRARRRSTAPRRAGRRGRACSARPSCRG